MAAHGQATSLTTAQITGSFVDLDDNDAPNCGDAIDYTVQIAASPNNALDTELVLPIDPANVIDPATIAVSAPLGTPQVRRADSVLDVLLGTVCGPAPCLPATITFRTYIAFNAIGPIFEQGSVSASNAPTVTTNQFRQTFGACFLTAPDLALAKTDGGLTVDPGQTIPYTLTVSNVGSATASQAVLQETVPQGTAFSAAASSPGWACTGTAPGSLCTFSLGNIPSGSSISRIFAVTANLPFTGSTVTNTATVSSLSNESSLANNTASDTTPVRPGIPDLALTKTLSGAATPGALLTYTLTLTNRGTATAAAASLAETVAAHTTFDAAGSSAGWLCTPSGAAGSSCSLAVGSVAPLQTLTRTFALRVVNPLPAGVTSIANTACATTSSSGDDPTNDCSTVTTPAQGTPALSLKKTLASGTGTPGSTLVFTLTATNNGNQGASSLVLSEVVPANTTFSAAASASGWLCSSPAAGSTCTLAVGSLPGGGGSVARAFAVVIDNPLPAGVTAVQNSACSTADPALSSCDTATVPTNGAPALDLTKTLASGSGAPGSLLVYRLTASNTGNQAAANLSLAETVPDYTTFVPASSSPGWVCTPNNSAGSACTRPLPNLAGGGGTSTSDFAVRIDTPLPAGVSAIANAACLKNGAAEASCDQISTPTTGSPVLSTTKTVTGGSPVPGATLVYTITVTNSGDQDASGVVLADQLPPGTSFVTAQSSPGWSCSPSTLASSTCSLAIGGLAAGATASRTFAVLLADPWPAGSALLTNTACATDASGKVSCSRVTTPTSAAPQLSLRKTYEGPPLAPGATLRFTLALTNTGNQVAAPVTVSETVPANSTFDAAASSPDWSCAAPAAGSSCTMTLASLAPGVTARSTFAVTAAQPLPAGVSQIANAACASTASGTPSCAEVSTPLPVALQATLDDLLAVDTDHDTFPTAGDVLLYTLVVSNPSAAAAVDVVVALPALDSHLTLLPESIVTSAGTVTASAPATSLVTVPSLAPGASVTITFRALIGPLPAGLRALSAQASVSGSNFLSLPSDDPATPESGDPTLTALRSPSPVREIPTLSEIGLLCLLFALAGTALVFLRRSPLKASPR